MTAWRRFAALLLPLLAQAALSQTIYRCGPEGRSYSQVPCADGKPVTVDDPRPATQQQAARDVAAGDAALARNLAEERRQREANAQRQAAGFATSPTPAASAPARKSNKPKKPRKATAEQDFTATSRTPEKASPQR